MGVVDRVMKYFKNSSRKFESNEAGIHIEKKDNEINGLSYSRGSYFLTVETLPPLQNYQNARKGRTVFKVEKISSYFLEDTVKEMDEHFLFHENLVKFKAFNALVMFVEEKYSESELDNNYKQMKDAHENNMDLVKYLDLMQSEMDNVKKFLSESNKKWHLVFVDEEHIQNFINYMKNFPTFHIKQINLNEYLSTTNETLNSSRKELIN